MLIQVKERFIAYRPHLTVYLNYFNIKGMLTQGLITDEASYLKRVSDKVLQDCPELSDPKKLVLLGVSCTGGGVTLQEFSPCWKTFSSAVRPESYCEWTRGGRFPDEQVVGGRTGFISKVWASEIQHRGERQDLSMEAEKLLTGNRQGGINGFDINIGYFRHESSKKHWIYSQLFMAAQAGRALNNSLFVGPLPVERDEIAKFAQEIGFKRIEFVNKDGTQDSTGDGLPVLRFLSQHLADTDYFALLTHEPNSIGGSGDSSYNRTLMGKLPYFDPKKFWIKQGAYDKARQLGCLQLAGWLILEEWEPVQIEVDDYGTIITPLRENRAWSLEDAKHAAAYAIRYYDEIVKQWEMLRRHYVKHGSIEKQLLDYVRMACEQQK